MRLIHYSKTLKDDLVFKNDTPVSNNFLKLIYARQYKYKNNYYIVVADTFLFEFLDYLENEYFSQVELKESFPKINFKKLKKLWARMGCAYPN